MNNVLQAAGRVIRRDDDRGIVVLIDDRYTSERYLPLYPDHWRGNMYAVGDPASLRELAARFWEKQD
jgi:DNA excision repair protein ERCC-2